MSFGSYKDALIILGDVFAKAETEEGKRQVAKAMKAIAEAEEAERKDFEEWWLACRNDGRTPEFEENERAF